MHPHYSLPPVVLALALGLISQAKAAQPLNLQDIPYSQLKKQFTLNMPGQRLKADVLGVDSLTLVKQRKDNKQVSHLRLQQYYAGFPVWGGYAIMHGPKVMQSLQQSNAKVAMTGLVYHDLQQELGAADSSFEAGAATALQQFAEKYPKAYRSEERVSPIVYVDDSHKAHWAYKVSLYLQAPQGIPQRPTAILDAKTYQPFVVWDTIKTVSPEVKLVLVHGIGFGGNPKMGLYQYGKERPHLQITRNLSESMCFMENKEVRVVDMEHNYTAPKRPMKFTCKEQTAGASNTYFTGYSGDGYDKDNGAASPSNDALYAGYIVKHMFHDWYGVEALTNNNGIPMKLIMRVHYGEGYENAYWDGKQMTFGDGESTMYPLVSVGISAHEISHGFTEQNSGLEYFGQSGGMNESFSDMSAQAAEYYASGKNNWQIGSEIIKEDSGYEALRFMDKPSKDGISIELATDYQPGLDVHHASGVYNRLFYILAARPEWGIRKAFDVMVKANLDYWTPYANFEEGGCGILLAARDLGYSLDVVRKSLTAVAIDSESCKISDGV
jgi:pseudolysin